MKSQARRDSQERQRRKRVKHKKLLADARERTLSEHKSLPGTQPHIALQEIHDDLDAMRKFARAEVDKLDLDKDFWRDTMAGKLPNEWVRLWQALSQDQAGLALRMIGAGLDARKTAALEQSVAIAAQVIDEALSLANAPPEVRAKLPAALEAVVLDPKLERVA